MKSAKAVVVDVNGGVLSPCSVEKARKLLQAGRAALVQEEPLTIRLPYSVALQKAPERVSTLEGAKRLLLHACCGPCSTYPITRLREHGFEVTGFWYNPNVHPWLEHERRRKSMARYAETVSLAMIWHELYDMPHFLRAVVGHESFRERCAICYRMRLEKTARLALAQGFDAITTTLLISPHQDQKLIRSIGEDVTGMLGLEFFFENLRQGWVERGRLTREHDLYRQQYCGCIYSEWERYHNTPIDGLLGAPEVLQGGCKHLGECT